MKNAAHILTVVLLGLFFSTGLTVFANPKRRPASKQANIKQRIKGTPVKAHSAADAQQPAPTPSNTPEDDISIIVNLRADSLRFDMVPNSTTVEFFGKPDRATVWEVERDNLPRPVQPGVTYRDIGIRLKITSRFRDIERIVAEALGEIPISDDAVSQPPVTANPQKSTPPLPERSPQKGRP